MRDPDKEPLKMFGGDVVELTKMVYAEREAHAAEVARLRAALKETTGACQLVANWHRNKTVDDALAVGKAVLAAPPAAAAQAVEGLVSIVKQLPCECITTVYPSRMSAAALESSARSELVQQCARCAALAAWKEATRG